MNIIARSSLTENMHCKKTSLRRGRHHHPAERQDLEFADANSAEGRLILADALVHCAREGADRMVDLATLTGAMPHRSRFDLRRADLERRRPRHRGQWAGQPHR